MVLTSLRESHSARGNLRIYAPKGPPEAISPGGPLQAHRGGDAANSKTALAGVGHVPWAQGWLDRLPCVL